MTNITESFFCSFCGEKIEQHDETGELVGAAPVPFQPTHWCTSLVACNTCQQKIEAQELKPDQFCCSFCGKQVKRIESKAANVDTDAKVVCVYEYGTILVCNTCLYETEIPANGACLKDPHSFFEECTPCEHCSTLDHYEAGSDGGECANCQCFHYDAAAHAAPEMYK